jgi:predicted nucleotidyltransferase
MRFGLDEKTIQQITSVLARYPQVEKALLYGSRAKGTYKTGSDIDLTLVGSEALTLEILYRIMDDLDDLLLPYSFDLSLFHDIEDPEVVEHIRRAGKVFYEKRTTKA